MSNPQNNLKYFTSVKTDDPRVLAESFEEILQREHESDGKHPIATSGNPGFISPEHLQMIERMWEWFKSQEDKQP